MSDRKLIIDVKVYIYVLRGRSVVGNIPGCQPEDCGFNSHVPRSLKWSTIMTEKSNESTESKLYEVELDSEDGNPIIVYHVANSVEDFILPIRVSHPNEIISVWEISDEDSLKRSTTKAIKIFGKFFDELQNSIPTPMDQLLYNQIPGGCGIPAGFPMPIDLVGDDLQLQIDLDFDE